MKIKMKKNERNQKILNCFEDLSSEDSNLCNSDDSLMSSVCLSTPKNKKSKRKAALIFKNEKKP